MPANLPELIDSEQHVCRYVEGLDGAWLLTTFFPNPTKLDGPTSGTAGTQPPWLRTILAVAAAADAFQAVPNPPPQTVLWFSIDSNGDFVRFSPI